MNQKPKTEYRKPRRDNKRPQNYYYETEKEEQVHRKPNRYPKQHRNDREDDRYAYKQRNDQREETYVYKQDLIQKGLEIASTKQVKDFVRAITDQFSECMNKTKRQAIIQTGAEEESHINKSKLTNREDLREDYEGLIGDEEIPDWFIDDGNKNEGFAGFDFGAAVQRTLDVNKEIVIVVNESKRAKNALNKNQENVEKDDIRLDEIDLNELDNYLEDKMKNQTRVNDSFDEDGLYDTESDDENKRYKHEDKEIDRSYNSSVSQNNSKNYFNNLEQNIKDMLFNKDEEEEESEESFEESLGFDNYNRNNTSKPKEVPTINTVLNDNKPPLPNILPSQNLPVPPPVLSIDDAIKDTLKGFDLKSHIEERKKIPKEERELKKKYFMQKYGYMDPIICQIVYEILNSKKRAMLNKNSANGFNQKSVQKFCSNKYKIFSMFLQGNIISKVWLYKDQSSAIQGPFMSYDMDIWNSDDSFFTENTSIALGTGPFLPIQLYIDRDPIVIEIVENFILKSQQIAETLNQTKQNRGFNQQKNNQKPKNPDKELVNKYQENFPSLGTTTANKWEQAPAKNEAPLIDLLRRNSTRIPEKISENNAIGNQDNIKRKVTEEIKQPPLTFDVNANKTKKIEAQPIQPIDNKHKGSNHKKQHNVKRDHVIKSQETLVDVDKKNLPTIEGNLELTNNLKNLLGL